MPVVTYILSAVTTTRTYVKQNGGHSVCYSETRLAFPSGLRTDLYLVTMSRLDFRDVIYINALEAVQHKIIVDDNTPNVKTVIHHFMPCCSAKSV